MAKTRQPLPYRKKRTYHPLVRPFVWLFKLLLLFLLLSVMWVLVYRVLNPPITFTMIGDMVAGRGATRDWIPVGKVDRDMVRAVIAAEDSKFCQHKGFDVDAIQEAARRNASGGKIRGGSTISQQTAKNAFLWQGGGYFRKGLEAWFTLLMETMWPKRRIMEVYLNVAETGIGTYGANAGSKRYFGHDASAMTRTEAARIAAVLPLPKARGAVTPRGFTRRYGNTITTRIGTVARDGLDACVYEGIETPPERNPEPTTRQTRPIPGDEYERVRVEAPAAEAPPATGAPVTAEPANLSAPVEEPSADEPPPPPITNDAELIPGAP